MHSSDLLWTLTDKSTIIVSVQFRWIFINYFTLSFIHIYRLSYFYYNKIKTQDTIIQTSNRKNEDIIKLKKLLFDVWHLNPQHYLYSYMFDNFCVNTGLPMVHWFYILIWCLPIYFCSGAKLKDSSKILKENICH